MDSDADIATFRQWLEEHGFEKSHEQEGGMDSAIIEYMLEHQSIQLLRDRGSWSIGLRFGSQRDWFHPDSWEVATTKASYGESISSLGHQIEFVKAQWVGRPVTDPIRLGERMTREGTAWVKGFLRKTGRFPTQE